ncbi:MAG: DUF4261 domain-containing protein, partial [Meiothermus sp.]|nr:DUF4261 domain-containing protein [Meiothermus sp.]
VLLREPVALEHFEPLLSDYRVVARSPGSSRWEMSGATAVLEFRPEANGLVALDVVAHPWPDAMGNSLTEAGLFSAWKAGAFGPYTFPGNLERALAQAWTWDKAAEVAPTHQGFVRLRSSYVFGVREDAPLLPKSYDPQAELWFLSDLALRLAEHPAALAYFNPAGEVLMRRKALRETLDAYRGERLPAFAAWANVRLLNSDERPDWLMMDTVGNWQLDIPDHELLFRRGEFDPSDLETFLRGVSLYVLEKGTIIKNGDTIQGPGGLMLEARRLETATFDPPRSVFRWSVQGASGVPDDLKVKQRVR